PLRRLYRSADAIVTYGPHVSAYVRASGAGNVYVAPQSVDNDFWRASVLVAPGSAAWPGRADTKFMFVGRPAREKGIRVLLEAWRIGVPGARPAALVLVGVGFSPPRIPADGAVVRETDGIGQRWDGVLCLDRVSPVELRNFYAACDVLVVPSIPTRTFREPW